MARTGSLIAGSGTILILGAGWVVAIGRSFLRWAGAGSPPRTSTTLDDSTILPGSTIILTTLTVSIISTILPDLIILTASTTGLIISTGLVSLITLTDSTGS